ncbi:MAG: hypothetical protein MI749_22775 [Desulfovibrionales bacterium]|nr:hypothetical protein [Desulfovibrionales bacterium]
MESTKLAISTNGPTLDDTVNPRFGRAPGFLIVDSKTLEHTYLDNGSSQAMSQGAGIQAAQNVAKSGATVVLTGYVGPKAFAALTAANVQIGQDVENMTVRSAVEAFNNGNVNLAASPNAPEKGGMRAAQTQAAAAPAGGAGMGRGQGMGGGLGRGMGGGQGRGMGGGRCGQGGRNGGGRF